MKTVNEESYIKSLYYWIYHVEKQKDMISKDLLGEYNEIREKFDKWRIRNVYNIQIPKSRVMISMNHF